MARTDNLTNFLTDVADSIREKKGTSEPILASDFDAEIDSIATDNVGTEIEDSIIAGTLEEYTNDRVTTVAIGLPKTIKKVSFPNVETITADGVLQDTYELQEIYFPKLKTITGDQFISNTKVSNFDFPSLEKLSGTFTFASNRNLTEFVFIKLKEIGGTLPFQSCSNFKTVIFQKSDDICKMTYSGVFSGSGIVADGGKILVPNHLVDTYKSATNWSAYADRIFGLDY